MSAEKTSPPADAPADDPDVLGLVPPGRGGPLLLAGIGLLVIALALVGPAWRPSLVHPDHSGGAARNLGGGRVLVGLQLEPRGPGALTVTGVDAPDGERVEAAWIVPLPVGADSPGVFGPSAGTVDAAHPPAGALALPARVPREGTAYLVVLFAGVSCDSPQAGEAATARLRALGVVPLREKLPSSISPQLACEP